MCAAALSYIFGSRKGEAKEELDDDLYRLVLRLSISPRLTWSRSGLRRS